jgi:hypothetical protein
VLDKVFRQREGQFRQILNEIRVGEVSPQANQILYDKMNETTAQVRASLTSSSSKAGAEIQHTKLFATNNGVDNINQTELQKLLEGGDTETYYCMDNKDDPIAFLTLQNGSKVAEVLSLAVGAQVQKLYLSKKLFRVRL